jgi:hypothetical protein
VSDPHNPVIEEYVSPTEAEIKARGKRNIAIALLLLAFVGLIFMLMLFKLGVFG